jgi:hypothetical protein
MVKDKFALLNIDDIRKVAIEGNWIDRISAIEYLWLINDDNCREYVLSGIKDEDLEIASIFILGEIGKLDDIPKLNQLINRERYYPLWNRHISDAIEKILNRSRSQ